jgi:deferrochelatase/peroxidase EfeB
MALDLADIQGNLFRGYRCANARHFALGVGDPASARAFLAGLISGNERRSPQLTRAEKWGDKPQYCLNVGLTWAGLEALGPPAGVLADFPAAFQEGPAARAVESDPDFPDSVGLGDVGASAPRNWILGGPRTQPVHIVVSLYTDEHITRRLEQVSARLRKRFAACGLTEILAFEADALPRGKVHFGYRDGIAQPRIEGGHGHGRADMQPMSQPGDFLLGRDYTNVYGGNYLGNLLPALGDNAHYGAFRILKQDVAGFERVLAQWGARYRLDPELVAAKLMGRWRNGVPLVLSPDSDQPQPALGDADLNEFDYAPGPGHETFYDDSEGIRCPVGAHIRRLNPRRSLVMGKPHTRRLVRRGMPYGPPYDPANPRDGIERGLVGLFLCGDLELQYEFIVRTWANEDLSTHGLRGTREPILGAQPQGGGSFTVRTGDSRDPLVMTGLQRLVQTVGSVYCFVPGIGGIQYLAATGDGTA